MMWNFLKLFLWMLCIVGCQSQTNDQSEESEYVPPKPISIPLNIQGGYGVNQITGDSIKPIINSFGKTVITGKPVFYNKKQLVLQDFYQLSNIHANRIEKVISHNSQFLIPKILTNSIPIDQKNSDSKVDINKNDSTNLFFLGRRVNINGRIRSFHEPNPSKSLPMRFKEEGSNKIQFLDVEQGLGFSYIYGLMEDSKKNIWFGTDGFGLSKYNGFNFINYTIKEGLVSNSITAIHEDHAGNIWIGTPNGISVLIGDKFLQYSNNEGLTNDRVLSILEDKNGNIWVGTSNGVIKFELINQSTGIANCIFYTSKEGTLFNKVNSFFEDKNGTIWFGTSDGMARMKGDSVIKFSINDELKSISVTSIVQDKYGNIWFGSNQGLFMFDGKKYYNYSEFKGGQLKNISSMLHDEDGNIWIGTRFNGLFKYDGKTIEKFQQQLGFTSYKISKIIQDSQKNIWCSIEGGGIVKFNSVGFNYPIDKSFFDFGRVRPIMKDSLGNLWFGTEDGNLYQYNKTHFFQYFFSDSLKTHFGFRSMYADKYGAKWFGRTDGGGLLKFKDKEIIKIEDKKPCIIHYIMSIDRIGNDSLAFATYGNGITILNDQKKISNQTKISRISETDGLSCNKVFKIFFDKNKVIWFGTDGGGLCKFDGTHLLNFSEKEGLFARSITSIVEDDDHSIWLGTLGAGVCKFDGKEFTYFTEQQGLSNNNVWSIIKDSVGQLWIGTDKGLNLLKKKNKSSSWNDYTLYSYGSQNGLNAIDFNLHSVCIDNDNRIWWGTGKGVPSLDLKNNIKQTQPVTLSIDQIEINEKTYDFRQLPEELKNHIHYSNVVPFKNIPQELRLNYDLNHLIFHFSSIDWLSPEKIKYSYRLKGLDLRWSIAKEATYVEYRNLNPGKYQFEIKAIGESQIFTEPINYSFEILPAWWQTWWFKVLTTIMIVGIVFIVVRLIYLSNLHKQKAELEKQLAVQIERQRISSEMHDDIGAGLSGIRLLTEFTRSKNRVGDITEEIDKIYQSIGDLSAKMREVIWSLNTDNDSLSSLVHYLQKQARIVLEHYPAELTISIPDHIPEIKILGQTRRNIYLSVKEALHNIIKHSEANTIDIRISCEMKIQIRISDNGKGMNLSQQSNTGNGIKNLTRRMQQVNGTVFFESQQGLILIFEIPFNK